MLRHSAANRHFASAWKAARQWLFNLPVACRNLTAGGPRCAPAGLRAAGRGVQPEPPGRGAVAVGGAGQRRPLAARRPPLAAGFALPPPPADFALPPPPRRSERKYRKWPNFGRRGQRKWPNFGRHGRLRRSRLCARRPNVRNQCRDCHAERGLHNRRRRDHHGGHYARRCGGHPHCAAH